MPTTSIDDIFKAEAKNPSQLLSRRGEYFYIPAYQRDYSWTKKKNLRRLVDDVVEGLAELADNELVEPLLIFIGALILVDDRDHDQIHPQVRDEVPAAVYVVIDGQQRITSLVLWAAALYLELRPLVEGLRKHLSDAKWRPIVTHADTTLNILIDMLHESQTTDDSYGSYRFFPRIIRSHEDQWSRNSSEAKYVSPVGRLMRAVSEAIQEPAVGFIYDVSTLPPQEKGRHKVVSDAFAYFRQRTKAYANGKEKAFPLQIKDVARSRAFQDTLWGNPWRDETRELVTSAALSASPADVRAGNLIRLTSLAQFVISRICFTAVKSKGDAYAFDMFDALNTTGEPLTAYETFKPLVVEDVGLSTYRGSVEYSYLEKIDGYLSLKPAERASRTEKLIIHTGLHETGYKGTKRLSEQRRWLRKHYQELRERTEKQDFLSDLVRLTEVERFFENSHEFDAISNSDATRLCVRILASANHDIVIPVIARFYDAFVLAGGARSSATHTSLEEAIRAVTAFSTLWRIAHGGTAGIDGYYRAIMKGRVADGAKPAVGPLCKRPQGIAARSLSVSHLRQDLRAVLDQAGLGDEDHWVAQAQKTPVVETGSRAFTKFFLAAAMNDAAVDPSDSKNLIKGHSGVCDLLRASAAWVTDPYDLEHIAPQNPATTSSGSAITGWASDIYVNADTKQLIGNATLLPATVNRALKNAAWTQKQAVFRLLTASTTSQAEQDLVSAQTAGDLREFPSLSTIVAQSAYHKHLEPLLSVSAWDAATIQARSKNLCELGYQELQKWLS